VSRVGFVGAGRIGGPMISRVAEAGHEVRVLVRAPEKAEAVRKLGAQPVTGLPEVADRADAVIVCVFSDEQVHEVCLHSELLEAMRPGSVLVVHTTGSPATAEAIAERAEAHSVDVVDAPISGGPHDVAAGHVTLFVGGDEAAVAHVGPVLSSYGDPVLHVGATGAGQRVKLINNALFAAQIGLVAEGVALGKRIGVDETTLLAALVNGSASSRALGSIATAGSVDAFIGAVGDFIGKDVAVIKKVVAEIGTDMGSLDDIVNSGLPT
jgi:3-hydroxyisobutyrate dehydrogenase